MATDRLIRESNPPSGRIASPTPQYKHYSTGEYEDAEGSDGAIHMGALTTKIVDLKSLLDNFGAVTASPTTNTLLERVKVIKTELDALQAQIGENTDVVVAAGAAGSVSAKLRRLTTDLDATITLLTTISGLDFAEETTQAANEVLLTTIAGLDFAEETTLAAIEVLLTTISGLDFAEETTQAANEVLLTTIAGLDFAEQTTLAALNVLVGAIDAAVVDAGAVGSLAAKLRRLTADLGAEIIQIGDTDAALVNAGAVGSLSAKMRRLTTDLDAFKTNFDAEVGMSVYSNSAPGAHAGETIGMTHLNITDGDLYVSTGAAWVLKLEGIWV